jgi:CRP-like cAMP-binding protein
MVAPGKKIEHVYFLESGLGSIVTVSPEGRKAEAGMFGREGFAPTPPAVGLDLSLHEVVVQSPGTGYRIEIRPFSELRQSCAIFASLLSRCLHNLSTQVSYTALSNGVHKIDVRLARWLLMCNDRLGGNEIVITHDYIAVMLAVRRPSVTDALHFLEGKGFIKSERKRITVRKRRAMEEFASDAYGGAEKEYGLLFGAPLAENRVGGNGEHPKTNISDVINPSTK